MLPEFSITTQEYEEFQRDYTMMVLKIPTYRYGQAFLNYFYPDAGEYLLRNSHLGGNPGHAPTMDNVVWAETSYKKAKVMIEDFIKIVDI